MLAIENNNDSLEKLEKTKEKGIPKTKVEEAFLELINQDKPIDIEIGFGKGNFILQKAIHYKGVNFIGFEVKRSLVQEVKDKILENKLDNAYVECSYAHVSIPDKVPNGRIRNIYVNFPDPWWKRRHKKRRILQKDYINLFYKSLQINGIIYIRTDVKEYAEFVESNFSKLEQFTKVEHDIVIDEIRSDREVRCIKDGLELYYLAFKKIK